MTKMYMTKSVNLTPAQIIEQRKVEQLNIQLKKNVEYKNKTTLFEDVFLIHNALPEMDRQDVKTSTMFLGKKFSAPLFVSAITGGSKESERINKNIAQACQKLGLGMGFGSMRAMMVEPSLTYTYQVRDVAPDIFLSGNIGAQDLKEFSIKEWKEALKKIGADFLAVHLNPAQELVQKEGNATYKGALKAILEYSQELPIYVKEVGQGISTPVAQKLSTTTIKAIEAAGAGGTSWTGIEYLRKGQGDGLFWDWGIPTALSVIMARKGSNLPLIATGGIRNGEQIVKALSLGANLCGIALPALKAAVQDERVIEQDLQRFITEIGDTMFLIGAKNVADLSNIKPIITGKLKELII